MCAGPSSTTCATASVRPRRSASAARPDPKPKRGAGRRPSGLGALRREREASEPDDRRPVPPVGCSSMSAEDLEQYEADIELQLYKEYKDLTPMFSYVVETDRRSYLANQVRQTVRNEGGRTYIELELQDAWVWDMYRTSRFVQSVKIVTFKDVNVEELPAKEL